MGGDPGGGRGDVDELRASGDVAGGPDVGIGSPLSRVDFDVAVFIGGNASAVQVEVRGSRPSAGRNQQLVAGRRASVFAVHGDSVHGLFDVDGLRATAGNAVVDERGFEQCRELGFGAWKERPDESDVTANVGEELCLFD